MQRSHIGNAFTNLHEGNTQSSHTGNAFIDLHVVNIDISKPFLNSNCTYQSKIDIDKCVSWCQFSKNPKVLFLKFFVGD